MRTNAQCRPATMADFSKEALQAAAKRVLEDLQARELHLQRFAQSATFERMVQALKRPEPCLVDEEQFLYFLEQEKSRVGWDFASAQDVSDFFATMSDTRSPAVEDLQRNSKGRFPSTQFQRSGLFVRMLFGQGVAVVVENEASARLRPSCPGKQGGRP